MITFDRIILIIILLWVSIYLGSYGLWTWKKKNRLGAVMVFLLAAATLVLPIYSVFIREG